VNLSQIKECMEVIGADGVHVGTVDRVEGNRVKLTRRDRGKESQEHQFLSAGLIAAIEGDRVRLSANADVALLFEEDAVPNDVYRDELLDEAGSESFPASDSPAVSRDPGDELTGPGRA
jgi:hypothetical protein